MVRVGQVYRDNDIRISRGQAPVRTLDVLKVYTAENLSGKEIPWRVQVNCRETNRRSTILVSRLQSTEYVLVEDLNERASL